MADRKHFPRKGSTRPAAPPGPLLVGRPFAISPREGGLYERRLKQWLGAESYFQGARTVPWRSVSDQDDRCLYAQATDTGVLPLFNFGTTSFYARQGLLTPLEGLFPAYHQSFQEMGWRRSFVDGHLFSVPLHLSIRLLFFRRDLLKKHGFNPPRTWAELQAQAQRIQRAERPRCPHGLLFNFNPSIRLSVFLDQLWSQGADLYESSPQWALNRPALGQALARLKGFFDSGVTPPAVLASDYGWSYREFLAGRSVFLHNWSDGIRMIRELPLEDQERFGWCPLPGLDPGKPGQAMVGGPSYVVPRHTRHPQAAGRLLKRLMQPGFQAWYAERLGWPFPGLKEVYFDARVLKARPYYAEAEDLLQRGKLLEECGYLQGHHPDWQSIGNQELTHFLGGVFDQRGTVARMEQRFAPLLPLPPYPGLVGQALLAIQARVEQPVSVAALARDLQVSPGHLSRVFRRETGQGLHQSMHTAKIERAKAVLREGQLTVSEVAYRLGYKTPQHFSRVFKDLAQRPPREFRP